MKQTFSLIMLGYSIVSTALAMGGHTTEVPWSISGDNCELVQTLGYAMWSCTHKQEVRSTGSGNA